MLKFMGENVFYLILWIMQSATLIQTDLWQQFDPLNTTFPVYWENDEDLLQYLIGEQRL